jgi:hypothetical protein
MKFGPDQIDLPMAIQICPLIREVVSSNPAWEYEQNEAHCCWACYEDWYLYFTWGVNELEFSEFKAYLVSKHFKAIYDGSLNNRVRESAIVTSPACIGITGRLLDSIEEADEPNFSRRISDLLVILQNKGIDGLARTWATERSKLLRNWEHVQAYVQIPWMNDDGSLVGE